MEYTWKNNINVYLGGERIIKEFKEKENEDKEDKDYISDIIDEDLRDCLFLYLRHLG